MFWSKLKTSYQIMDVKKAVIFIVTFQLFWICWYKEILSITLFHPLLFHRLPSFQNPLRVACLGTNYSIDRFKDSYYMRCTQLIIYAERYMPGITIEALTFEQGLNVKEPYDAAIFIKATPDCPAMWPTIWKNFKKIYLDVIDGVMDGLIDFDRLKLQEPRPVLIAQSPYQEALYNDTFKTVIIEHMPASMNKSDMKDISSFRTPLQAVSVMSSDGHNSTSDLCQERETMLVNMKCLVCQKCQGDVLKSELFSIQDIKKESKRYKIDIKKQRKRYKNFTSKIWGKPYLFTQLFRKYDVVVVFTKKGVKTTINSVQRMTNTIYSGVITVIERTGLHALYVSKNYPCSFTNQEELEIVLDSLATNISVREECQRQAILLNEIFSPETIMKKYYDMLTSDL